MTLGVIIQARCGSSRLPLKVLLKLGKKTILEHVINRIRKLKYKKKIIIATTKKSRDKKIIEIANKNKCFYFAGSEKNVLDRYYNAAKKFKIKTIIRICSDSPFIDSEIIEKGLKIYKKKKYDYVSNIIRPTYPAGMSVEIFNFKSLKKSFESITDLDEKEHVTPYIYRNPKLFRIKNFATDKKYKKYRFAVDYQEDYLACSEIQKVIRKLRISKITLLTLAKIIDKNPYIKKLNETKKTILRY
jgi:spore coat polysaccharide biosynthesis protein SpsF